MSATEAFLKEWFNDYTENKTCVVCGGSNLLPYLDLGNQPLANSYHKGESLRHYPLGVQVCQGCWHSQLTVSVKPQAMFDHYVYVSDTSKTLTQYFRWLTKIIIGRRSGPMGATWRPDVLEIACNSGLFLEMFKKEGCQVMGVDPAKNLRPLSQARDLNVIEDYWTEELARKINRKFDVVLAIHVLPHVPDPLAFLKACKAVLAHEGRIYVQTSQCDMFKNKEFDAVYHEHTSYFTAHSLKVLAERAGLQIRSIGKQPIHSMSFLVELEAKAVPKKKNQPVPPLHHTQDLQVLINQETQLDLNTPDFYRKFSEGVKKTAADLKAKLKEYTDQGIRVVGYGASAKGNTLLNYADIDLAYIVDDNELKHGLMTPGKNVPIVGIDKLKEEEGPVAVILLAWNFAPEIVKRVKEACPDKDHRFIVYFPEVKEYGN